VGGQICIWTDLAADPDVSLDERLQTRQVVFSPDGSLIAISDLKGLAVYNSETSVLV
jgi:hypothetical protein